jgi:hypothetical protein
LDLILEHGWLVGDWPNFDFWNGLGLGDISHPKIQSAVAEKLYKKYSMRCLKIQQCHIVSNGFFFKFLKSKFS